jgi:hypothetical protein
MSLATVRRAAGEYNEEPVPRPWISAAALKAKVFPPLAWVIPGYLPQGISLLAGRPKLGKSWLALDWAVAVAGGGFTLGDVECPEGDVLYAALEDNERRLQARMEKVTTGGEWPKRLDFICAMPRADEGGVELVREWLNDVQNPRLVIIDVLAKVRPGKARDEGNYDADYTAVTMWKTLADEFNVAIVLIHHVRKMVADDPLEMISGTNGLTGAADLVLILNRDSQGVTLGGRGRDLEEFDRAIQFNRDTCRWCLLGESSEARRSDERLKIISALKEADEPLSPAQISSLTGMEPNNVDQLLLKMTKTGEVTKPARGKYGPPDTPDKNDKKVRSDLEGGDA